MNAERARELELGNDIEGPHLTVDEIKEGWHFCFAWDGMLVNRFDKEGEGQACTCYEDKPKWNP